MGLTGKRIVLGVSGGIAAYKTPELVRRLRDRGADVRVVMTDAAKAFITPLSLQAVSGYPVSDDLLDPAAEAQTYNALLRPPPEDLLEMVRIGNAVNKVANDGPEVQAPYDPATTEAPKTAAVTAKAKPAARARDDGQGSLF